MPAAYHTSIAIDDVEYAFTPNGIKVGGGGVWGSHRRPGGMSDGNVVVPDKVVHMGLSKFSGGDLMKAIAPFFRQGTYDLLRKNCNSFSDCALYFLLGRRLDGKYAVAEQLAASADESMGGVLQYFSCYAPNPKACDFEVLHVLPQIGSRDKSVGQVLFI